jgi:hypothetical protein
LKKIFNQYKNLAADQEIDDSIHTIAADSFLYSKAFSDFQEFRRKKHALPIGIYPKMIRLSSTVSRK